MYAFSINMQINLGAYTGKIWGAYAPGPKAEQPLLVTNGLWQVLWQL